MYARERSGASLSEFPRQKGRPRPGRRVEHTGHEDGQIATERTASLRPVLRVVSVTKEVDGQGHRVAIHAPRAGRPREELDVDVAEYENLHSAGKLRWLERLKALSRRTPCGGAYHVLGRSRPAAAGDTWHHTPILATRRRSPMIGGSSQGNVQWNWAPSASSRITTCSSDETSLAVQML